MSDPQNGHALSAWRFMGIRWETQGSHEKRGTFSEDNGAMALTIGPTFQRTTCQTNQPLLLNSEGTLNKSYKRPEDGSERDVYQAFYVF